MEQRTIDDGELRQWIDEWGEESHDDILPSDDEADIANRILEHHTRGEYPDDVDWNDAWESLRSIVGPALEHVHGFFPDGAETLARYVREIDMGIDPDTGEDLERAAIEEPAFRTSFRIRAMADADPDVIEWVLPREGDGTPEGRDVFDPLAFATSEGDTLYLLSAQGRPSTALTASLTAVVAFTAFQYAQSECTDNNRRLPRPMCCVLDEAANICRWPELADVYSYFGSAGIPIMTIWQNPDQGKAAFGETNFGSLFNNANILVYLGGIKDAKWLGEISSLVGQREIVRGSLNIDGQGRRSVNNSIQKENILDVSDLAEWPVGRALVLASQCRAQIDRTMPWTENRVWADIIRKAA